MVALNLLLFAITIALVALYGLSLSGHFPAEFRSQELQTESGTVAIWATLIVACLAAITAVIVAVDVLPWFAIVISGGAGLLVAPLALRPFPDRFVNGPIALISFATSALLFAVVMWSVR